MCAATTVTLSDALLPMPPGETGTESLEFQASMPLAAGASPHGSGGVPPGPFNGGDVQDARRPSDSGGAAQLPSTIWSDSPTAGEQAVPAASPVASDAPAASRADPSDRGGEAPASAGSTHTVRARAGRADQQPQWRDMQSLLVANNQAQGRGSGGGDGRRAVAQSGAGGAGDTAGRNTVDGAMRVTRAAGVGVGSVSPADAKSGEVTVAAQGRGKGSWMATWVCCGTKSVTDS